MQMNPFLGKQFGSYRLVREIARGGFGTVYQAEHTILSDRLVAIKVLHDLHLNSSQERDAFLQEAQFLEKLKHPFILPLLDVGIQQNVPFLITEYAAPGSLRTRLQTQLPQLLTFQEILTILSQIGEALQYAHQQNIIHRDIKPDNILFNRRGDALLADFGVATVLSTASIGHTSTTGTPAYMAPEQFRGQVSRESDQYSLGCIAYELFTGRKPFAAPDFIALGFKHATEAPVPPRQINPSIPIQVEQAILTAMAKERSRRYADIATFTTALQVVVPSRPPPAKRARQPFEGNAIQASAPTEAASVRHPLGKNTVQAPAPTGGAPSKEANSRPALFPILMIVLGMIGVFYGVGTYSRGVVIIGVILMLISVVGLIIINERRRSTGKPRSPEVAVSRHMLQASYTPKDIEVTHKLGRTTVSFMLVNRHVVVWTTSFFGPIRLYADGKAIPPEKKGYRFKIEEVDCLWSQGFLGPKLEVGGVRVF